MTGLDEFFGAVPYDHPKVRYWQAKRSDHRAAHASVEIRRPRAAVGHGTPRIHFVIAEAGKNRFADSEPWDPQLDEALIEAGFAAKDEENESLRFSLLLRYYFTPVESLYGDGFFNSVFVAFVRQSAFGSDAQVQKKLADVHAIAASNGPSRDDCETRIKASIARCGAHLVSHLKYERNAAARVLSWAIAAYLDERFSVTERKRLGFT